MENDNLISMATHLTESEAQSIANKLKSLGVQSMVNNHNVASKYRVLYFEVKIHEKDIIAAKQVLAKHKAKAFLESKRCPKCKSLNYEEIEKRGLWEKLFYVGTTLVQCKKCKAKYPV